MPITQSRLGNRVVGQEPPGLRQGATGGRGLPDVAKLLAQLLPGFGKRACVGRAAGAARVDRSAVQPHGVGVGEALGRPLGREHRVSMCTTVVASQRKMARQHCRVCIEMLLLETEADRLVQFTPQLERQAPVGHLLEGGPQEAHFPVAVLDEHRRQPVPEPSIGQLYVRSKHVRQVARIE